MPLLSIPRTTYINASCTSWVIVGINASQRVEVVNKAVPGSKHVIACLVANGRWPSRGAASICVTRLSLSNPEVSAL